MLLERIMRIHRVSPVSREYIWFLKKKHFFFAVTDISLVWNKPIKSVRPRYEFMSMAFKMFIWPEKCDFLNGWMVWPCVHLTYRTDAELKAQAKIKHVPPTRSQSICSAPIEEWRCPRDSFRDTDRINHPFTREAHTPFVHKGTGFWHAHALFIQHMFSLFCTFSLW